MNKDEEGDDLTPVFTQPRIDATFARGVCLDSDDETLGSVEVVMDDVFKHINSKVKELSEQEEVDEDELIIAVSFGEVNSRVKEIVIDRLLRLNYEVANVVDTEEEADYIRDLEKSAETDDSLQPILDEFFLASDNYYISW